MVCLCLDTKYEVLMRVFSVLWIAPAHPDEMIDAAETR